MTISITPQLEEFVKEQVAAGRYASNSEVIRAGLQLLQNQESEKTQRQATLKQWVKEGLDDSVIVDAATVRSRVLRAIEDAAGESTVEVTPFGAE